jgi:uncharacterized protein (DUF885 family)
MPTRRRLLAGSAAALALAACASDPTPAPLSAPLPVDAAAAAATAALTARLDAIFDARVARDPQFATSLGDKQGYDRWTDPSDANARQELALARKARAEIADAFAPESLSPEGQLSHALFLAQVSRQEEAIRWRRHGLVFNQMFGAQTSAPTFLITQHKVDTRADAEALIARLQGLGPQMDAFIAESEASRALGVLAPRFVYGYVKPAALAVITGAPFAKGADSPLWADVKGKVSKLPEAEARPLLAAAEAALKTSVKPAYERLLAVLEDQERAAGLSDGAWRLPEGEAYYASRLQAQTTTKLTAEEIHQIGLENVARLHAEMLGVLAKVGGPKDLKAAFQMLETDPRFFLPDTPAGKADYIARATAAIEAMKAKTPAFFNRMPKAALEVRAVEAFREASAGLAFYQRPAADGSRPGYYYANTVDMKALPLYQLEALAFHEGVPGHHFQIALAQELEGLPKFRRFGLGLTAYTEGWALYTERLAKDMGFYEDPYADIGRMVLELRRAIRLVVDTGLHAKRWPREQGVQYILDNQPGDRAQAVKDIDRYIVMPAQATAYMIGQREILRLRDEAKARLGARFDIRGFHDVVLGQGEMPLDMLAARVGAWGGGTS